MILKKNILLSALFILFGLFAMAQNGSISGVITDGRDSTNKPIFGAQVFIAGTTYGAFTGMDGSYTLTNVAPGKYDITVSYVLIGEQKIENVKVEADQNTIANFAMGESVSEVVGVKIVITKNKESENTAVNEMKNSEEVVEIVSNAEMSAKGDNKASDAAKRVSGVSIIDGKYAYIRGLSDRYTKTMLNGAEIPGMDPDRVAAELDLFPSVFIQSMDVVKTFSPDLPGDFTGGLINIKTKESFDSLTIKASLGIGYNPQVHLQNEFLAQEGGSLDWLGIDDGSRSFSDEVNAALAQGQEQFTNVASLSANDTEEIQKFEEFNKSLNNRFEPIEKTVPVNHNFNITIGNSTKIDRKKDTLKPQRKFGYIAGLNYRRSYEYYGNGQAARFDLENNVVLDSALLRERDINIRRGKDEVLVGALGSVFFRFNPNHKIGLNLIHNHTGTSSAQYGEGFDIQTDGQFRIRRLEYLQRSMNTAQLNGEHSFDTLFFGTPTKIDWLGSYTLSQQKQPDLRFLLDEVLVQGGDTIYNIKSNVTRPTRFNREMNQQILDFKLNATKEIKTDSLGNIVLKTGGAYVGRFRDFSEVRLLYVPGRIGNFYNGNGNDYISDENFNIIFDTVVTPSRTFVTPTVPVQLQSQFSLDNQYTARQNIYAYYLMGNIPITKNFSILTGARAEITDIFVDSESERENTDGELSNFDILPSINLTYQFYKNKFVQSKKDTNDFSKRDLKLQFVYSKTLARPLLREIAPFRSFNFTNGYTEIGNPDLGRALIDNFDLRLEYYPNSGELMSLSLFTKLFNDPIERIATEADNEFSWTNSSSGIIYGVELEYRRSLDFISSSLKNFKLGVNTSLLTSRVKLADEALVDIKNGDPFFADDFRPLQGQSAYIANSFLQYKLDSAGITMNLTYNVFGDRIYIAQQGGTPNLYEKGRGELNFNITKKFSERSKITLRARNLLNPSYEYFYRFQNPDQTDYQEIISRGPYVFESYKKGRSYSVSYSYTF